ASPQWFSGEESTETALLVRRIYDAGELLGQDFALTKAQLLECVLENTRVACTGFDPFAMVCERCREIVWITNERNWYLSQRILGAEEWQRRNGDYEEGFFESKVDLSHTAPDWEAILALGIPGLIARAEEKCRQNPSPFYQAVLITFRALRKFALRFAEAARSQANEELAEMLEFLAENPPRTLQQALELSFLYREMQEMEGENLRSMGIFDRLYYPFYQHDIEAGILTPESAEELLLIYFSHCHAQSRGLDAGVPFCFGGLLPDGVTDGCNELTRLSLRAFRRLGLVDPKFSLRINPGTPEDVISFALECIKEGKSSILFVNEPMIRRAFLRNGKSESDLHNFVPIGCYEPAIMGKELCCSMTGTMNMAKAVEYLMEEEEFAPRSFQEVLTRFIEILLGGMKRMMDRINALEAHWHEINPVTSISGTMASCMERGLDATCGGTVYSASGLMCAGIGTLTDSLAAIKYLVFDQQLVTFQELRRILAADWEGQERLRLTALKRAPKWGVNNDYADEIARTVTDAAADLIESYPNGKGGHFQMGLWSIDWCLDYGRRTGATPDGRRRGETISKNSGSTIGCDTEGAAGLISSVTKLDYSRFANGSVLDMMLPVSSVQGETGTRFMADLFRTFSRKGGAFMHFNVLSAEAMRAAQKEPEKYRNLQIRLCGWNVRFIDLKREQQDCLIREAESKEA
ncbi:MAG: hypothetical protein J6S21_07810, partial [Victivallales bacterium]|nr:hypothetical protein [Victivallales bacterium]